MAPRCGSVVPCSTTSYATAADPVLIYVDSSVLGRAYLADEPGHADARDLLEGADRLVTGTLTRIEVTGLLVRATRAGRLDAGLDEALATLADDLGDDGTVTVVRPSDQGAIEEAACAITTAHGIRALDALHIAVAQAVLPELADPGESTAFASRDGDQAAAAEAVGLGVV